MPRFLHDSHLVFLSLLPLLVRALEGQLSARLRVVGAALLGLGMLRLGQIADGRRRVTSVPTLLEELISRCRDSNHLFGETDLLRYHVVHSSSRAVKQLAKSAFLKLY